MIIKSIKVVVHSDAFAIHANGRVESLLGSVEELSGDAHLLLSGSTVERESGTCGFVEVIHGGGGERITLAEVEDGVGSGLSVVFSDIGVEVDKPNKSGSLWNIEVLKATPLSVNSFELIVEGIEMVVHGGTDSVHTHGGVESLLRSIQELAGNTLLLVSGGFVESKSSSLIFVEVIHGGGGERITFAEVENRVGSGLSMVLIHVRGEVCEAHVLL